MAWTSALTSSIAIFREEAKTRGITVFPGFEVASSEGVHVLCLYSPAATDAELQRFLGQLDITKTEPSSSLSKKSFSDLLECVKTQGGLSPQTPRLDAITQRERTRRGPRHGAREDGGGTTREPTARERGSRFMRSRTSPPSRSKPSLMSTGSVATYISTPCGITTHAPSSPRRSPRAAARHRSRAPPQRGQGRSRSRSAPKATIDRS
jgi:hypothetical protein